MPLHIGASGTITQYVKFNAKADKWFVRGDDGDVEIQRPTFVADFANIATGWLRFREGEAPERVIDPSLDRSAPSPGEGFKRGFVLQVFSPKYLGGAVELSSASIHLCNAIRELYAEYEEQRGAHAGRLPVVACTGSEAMKDKYGTNYRPRFEIKTWVDRPAELPDEGPVEDIEVWRGATTEPRAQAQHVPPPQPAPAPATASADLGEALF